jgi:hypothetical protein
MNFREKICSTAVVAAACSIAAPQALAACDLETGVAGCEEALRSPAPAWIEMIDGLATSDTSGSGRTLASFYIGAAYYRLFVSEAATTLRCEYGHRAQERLDAFVQRVLASNDAVGKDLYETLLRAKIYLGEIDRDGTCPARGFPVAKLGELARSAVETTLSQALSDPGLRATSGMDALFQYAGDQVAKAADMLAKLRAAETELQSLRTETRQAGDGALGLTATRVEPWQVALRDPASELLRTIDAKTAFVAETRHAVDAIDVDGLRARSASLEEGFKAYALRLSGWLTRGESFVARVVVDNAPFRAGVAQGNAASAALVLARAHADGSLTAIAGALKRKNQVKCLGDALTDWYCKTGR